MATLSHDRKANTRSIQIPIGGGRRTTIRLGKMPQRMAERFRARVEDLLLARDAGQPLDAETQRWLAELSDVMHDRLSRAGLTGPRAAPEALTLAGAVADWLDEAEVDSKTATVVRMRQALGRVVEHFGTGTALASLDRERCEAWRLAMRKAYSQPTVSRDVLYARQFFAWCVRKGRCLDNPFGSVRAGPQTNASRQAFVPAEAALRVMDAAPSAQWRALIALSRFGGLRVPSEALTLTWDDVDWASGRLRVRSPKTERHEGRGERLVPLFPEVRAALQAVYDAAPEGGVRVFDEFTAGTTVNQRLRTIIRRAGLVPWEKAWHNMRASRQTELTARHPAHVVCAWLGNTKAIAADHYLQVTDADWERAVGGGAESGARAVQNAVRQPRAAGGQQRPA